MDESFLRLSFFYFLKRVFFSSYFFLHIYSFFIYNMKKKIEKGQGKNTKQENKKKEKLYK